jgi:hypothetical protein
LGERRDELQTPAVSSAKAAVSSIRDFVVVDLVGVDFIGHLMGGNRTTFECETIRLVGYGIGENVRQSCSLLAEEVNEKFSDASGFFVLEPVRSVGERVEFGGVAVAETVVSHIGEEKGVAFAPKDAGGDVDGCVRKFAAMAKSGAVPVDHASERAGLRPRGAVLG